MSLNKKICLILFLCILFLPFSVKAYTYGMVNDRDGLNIRTDYSSSGTVVTTLLYRNTIKLVDKTIYTSKDNSCPAGWYKVIYNENENYACSTYLDVYESGNNTYTAKVNCAGYISVWDRTIKDWSFNTSTLVDKLITGTYFTILDILPSGGNCDTNWYHIKYQNSKTGYVCSNDASTFEELTLKTEDYTEDEVTYANNLKALGFKDSYLPYLMRMKRNHPNWNFIPYTTGLRFNDVINGEEGKNKIESTTTTYLNYYISSSIGTEGGNWYFTNSDTNAHFLDPRNFLSERFIFMYEDLQYNIAYHTSDIVNSFLTNTWLNTDLIKGYFFDAATKHNISPLHLIARIFKEGGSRADYGPITGTYNGTMNGISLYGLFNFYNIGAYSDWVQGLCFAGGNTYSRKDGVCYQTNLTTYARPWTSIESAIVGGAEFISEDYIKPGQNTLYFQKFNVKVPNYYTHQYMTNIMAPSQEAETMYYKLKGMNMLDKNFTFIIPIYEDLLDDYPLPSAASTDNSLRSISINNILIDNFDSDVLEYTYHVQNDVTSIELKAVTNDSTATIVGNGTIQLNSDEETISIIVKAENNDTKTYSIKIIKVTGVKNIEEIISTLSTKVNGNNMSSISPKTDSSSLINSIKKADPTSIVIYKNSTNEIITGTITIKTNDTITITSSSNETVTYKLIVNGDVSGDGEVTIFDLLKVQKHILNSAKLNDAFLLAGDTNSDNKVDILDLLRVQKHIKEGFKL